MFESLFEESNTLDLQKLVLVLIVSIICGLVTSLVYVYTHKNKNESSGFAITLFMLPVIVGVIIILVASDFARAFSIAGVFALIRFRSEPGESKDITYILLASGLGLACGLGYIWLSLIILIVCMALIFLLEKINYGKNKFVKKQLKITLPESLDYENIFDDVLNNYCDYKNFIKVKTTDYGSLFEVTYQIALKDNKSEKSLIDDLRILNGNLDISIHRIVN